MKKVFFALLAISSIVACKRDDVEDLFSKEAPIVGKWKLSKITTYSGKDFAVITEVPLDECDRKSSIEFTEDNKYFVVDFDKSDKGECLEIDKRMDTYQYNKSTKKLKIVGTGVVVDVKTITSRELIYEDTSKDIDKDGTNDREVRFYVK